VAAIELIIPAGRFDGYIFDCDGTLIDSMPVHFRAWDAALRRLGATQALSEELFYSFGGIPTRRVARLFIDHYALAADPEELFHLKEKLFVDKLATVELIAPVVDFACKVARTHPVSVASGGPRDVVLRSLQLSGLAGLFPVVVTADDVSSRGWSPEWSLRCCRSCSRGRRAWGWR
jgi:beta-phosphoglucomutase-like phosphatase (HAD superfamily)